MKHAVYGLLLCLVVFAVPACREGNLETSEERVRATYPGSRAFNDTAAFIAGLPLDEGSSYTVLAAAPEYLMYRKRIEATWERYVRNNLQKIEEWRAHNLEGENEVLFYPFSADILNAVAFFPDAREYIMMGLESPGMLPAPLAMTPRRVYDGLGGCATRFTLCSSTFSDARDAVGPARRFNQQHDGIMMFFLARSGRDPRHQSGDDAGVRRRGRTRIRGVEFTFRKGPAHPFSARST